MRKYWKAKRRINAENKFWLILFQFQIIFLGFSFFFSLIKGKPSKFYPQLKTYLHKNRKMNELNIQWKSYEIILLCSVYVKMCLIGGFYSWNTCSTKILQFYYFWDEIWHRSVDIWFIYQFNDVWITFGWHSKSLDSRHLSQDKRL